MDLAGFPARWAQLAVGVAALAVAAFVLFSAPSRPVNRRLALMLTAQGVGLAAGWGLTSLAVDPRDAYAWNAVGAMAYYALVPLHLLFLGTLPTPLTRPFSSRAAAFALGVAAVAAVAAVVAIPGLATDGRLAPGTTSVWSLGESLPYTVLTLVHGLLSLYALAAAIDLLRRSSPGTTTRRQSVAYAAAFGWRDAMWALFLLVLTPSWFPGIAAAWWRHYALAGFELGFVLLIAYGALKFQLLDLDLRIKWGIRRGAIAAAFLAVFIAGAQVAENYLSGEFGLVAGGVAAGLLVFALRPLERVAGRIADASMPEVRDTPEYRLVRKRDLYRAAVESAATDGLVTLKEREVLVTLADKLGLSVREAHEIERETLAERV